MNPRRTVLILALGFAVVVAMAATWEFVLEDRVTMLLLHDGAAETTAKHLLSLIVFSGLALVALGLLVYALGRQAASRIAIERKLAAQRADYDAIASNPDWLWEIDVNTVYTFASPKVRALLGYDPEEIIGRTPFDLMPADEADRTRPLFAAILERRETFPPMENIVLHKDGRRLFFETSGVPIHDERGVWRGYRGIDRDITARKEMERDLAEREELYRMTFRTIPDAISLARTSDGAFLDVNEGFTALTGYRREDVLGRTPDDLELWANPDDRQRMYAILKSHGEVANFESTFRHRDGTTGYGVMSVRTIELRGEPHLLIVNRNVTDRVRAEQALRQSEERLRAVFENTPICLNLKDTDGRYLLVNEPYTDWLGFAAEQIIGKTARELLGDMPEVDKLEAAERQVVETGRANERIIRIERADKTHHRILIKFPVKSPDGTVGAVGTVAVDITERIEAEEALQESQARLRAIMDNSPVAIYMKDLEGRFLAVNDAYLQRRRLTMDQVVGHTTYAINPKPVADEITAQERMVLESGRAMTFEVTRNLNGRNGTELMVVRFPVLGPDGRVRAIGAVGFDISDRRALERQLLQAQKMEAVGQLTGGVAHDFNNLLQVILLNLELVQTLTATDARTAELIDRAITAGRRGATLTQQLLVFSRKQQLNPKTVDPNALLEGMVVILDRTLGEDIAIETEFAPDVPAMTVDPNGLESALLNLAVNARAAMPVGGTLRIRTATTTLETEITTHDGIVAPGTFVEIAVTDDGIGMPPEIAERAFEPFFTTKDVGQGSGLGLSMVYGFVNQSGGHVTLESAPGQGTTVRMLLRAAERPPEAGPCATPGDAVKAESGTVLVVEDDPDVRAATAMVLSSIGYRVIDVADGVAALAALKGRTDIDILFSDVVMPRGINGFELAESALRLSPGLRVLLTSGYPKAELRKTGQESARFNVLPKPYTREELVEALARVRAE